MMFTGFEDMVNNSILNFFKANRRTRFIYIIGDKYILDILETAITC